MEFAFIAKWQESAGASSRCCRRSCAVSQTVPNLVFIAVLTAGASYSATEYHQFCDKSDARFPWTDESSKIGNGAVEEERCQGYHACERRRAHGSHAAGAAGLQH
ncbi:hypothetical protein D3C80_1501820 [compost metagenome]